MHKSTADRARAQPASMAMGDRENAARERRFWMGVLYAGLASYSAVIIAVLGYTLLTWDQPNRALLVISVLAMAVWASTFYVFRHRLVAARWRLAIFAGANITSFLFIMMLRAVDGGIASPLTCLYLLPMLFLAIGYPVRFVLVCGSVGIAGFVLLAGFSPQAPAGFAPYMQLVALSVGFVLAILGAKNQDRQSQSLLVLQNRLEHMATTDALSGCLNQRAFHETLTREIARAARYRHPIALLLIDLDDFKPVNDRHGHMMGDEILRDVGTVIRASARNVDVCGRIGGDEFAVLAPETDQTDAMALAERLLQHMRQHPTPVRITLSVGVCALMPDMEPAATLFRRADKALYEAKHRGRDQIVGYDEVGATPRPGTPCENVV